MGLVFPAAASAAPEVAQSLPSSGNLPSWYTSDVIIANGACGTAAARPDGDRPDGQVELTCFVSSLNPVVIKNWGNDHKTARISENSEPLDVNVFSNQDELRLIARSPDSGRVRPGHHQDFTLDNRTIFVQVPIFTTSRVRITLFSR